MQSALRITTTVLPGGKIEVTNPELPTGKSVDVIVLFPESPEAPRHSIMDVLAKAPGQLMFRSAEEVDTYLREERDSWER